MKIDKEEKRLAHDGSLLPPDECVTCGYAGDCATAVHGEARPKPGDITMCINCGEIYRFGPEMHMVLLDPADLFKIALQKTEAAQTIFLAQKIIRERGRIWPEKPSAPQGNAGNSPPAGA